jgi:hypothetical protein
MMRRATLRRRRPEAELSPRALALRAKRKAEREARARALRAGQFGPQAALCRRGPCQACRRAVLCDPHHEPYRSHGGKDEDTCALCVYGPGDERGCHWLRHHMSLADFEARAGRTVASMVGEMRDRLAALSAPTPAPSQHESNLSGVAQW